MGAIGHPRGLTLKNGCERGRRSGRLRRVFFVRGCGCVEKGRKEGGLKRAVPRRRRGRRREGPLFPCFYGPREGEGREMVVEREEEGKKRERG